MKKIKILSPLSVCLLTFLSACGNDDTPVPVTAKTVLMYLVGDSDISNDIYNNIASVERGLSEVTSPGAFVIYQGGGSRKGEFPIPTLFRYEVDGKGSVSKREVIKTHSSQNSVSNEVMANVLKDVEACCPAEKYSLILGSRVTGWLPADYSKSRSFGDDSGAKIHTPDLSKTLEQLGIHLDYISFDACLMSQVEVVYELRNTVDYLIPSPAEVMSVGFPYFKITKYLSSVDNSEQNAINVVKDFIDYYKNEYSYSWGTIAVIKTNEISALANIICSIMKQYQNNLVKFDNRKIDYSQAHYGCGRSPLDHSAHDFRAFIRELIDNNIPSGFEEQLERVVIYKNYIDDYKLVNIDSDIYLGIGCYIPDTRYLKWNTYFRILQWYLATGWDETGWQMQEDVFQMSTR